MSFYIVFDNLSTLFEACQSVNLAEDCKTSVTDSVDTVRSEVSEVVQAAASIKPEDKILLIVDNSLDEAASTIDYDKGAAALLSKIPAATALEAIVAPLPRIELEVSSQNEDNEKIYPIFEKLEISLRYRIDHADIFRNRQEIENSVSTGKLAEKNLEKEDTEQTLQAERRFQEKQAENLRECLKQKRFAIQLQNKSDRK